MNYQRIVQTSECLTSGDKRARQEPCQLVRADDISGEYDCWGQSVWDRKK